MVYRNRQQLGYVNYCPFDGDDSRVVVKEVQKESFYWFPACAKPSPAVPGSSNIHLQLFVALGPTDLVIVYVAIIEPSIA